MPNAPERFDHRAFRFGCAIVRLYTKLANTPSVPLHLARQILRSGTSIGANLEEAWRTDQAGRHCEFSIALKEARETACWLRLLDATGLAGRELIHPALAEAEEPTAILTTARRRLQENRGTTVPRKPTAG